MRVALEQTVSARWATMSRAERDAAYDNSGAVADVADHRETRTAASLAYRAAHEGKLDIPYGALEPQRWDLFPAAKADAPCLVFIHGGYWQMNSRETFAALAEGVAAHGWSVALPGYRLAPEATLTEIVGDIHAALDWLGAHGTEHGIGGKIVVSGWSAGGHLTAMALGHPCVAAGLAISGVFELGPIRDIYLNEKLRLTEEEIVQLSPLRLPVVAKPLAIAYGTRELPALVEDSRALHALRAAAHAPGPLLPVAGANHFTILPALQEKHGLLVRAALDLLR
jgi:acetyl esterase/lipase